MESVKQEVVPAVYYAYPDVILTCDPADTGDEEAYWVRSPLLLVEVLSDSTAFHDFNFKLAQYQKISSLQYYLLVAQDTCGAHLFSRDSDAAWRHHAFETKDAAVELPVIQFSFQLEDVYKGLKMA
jgi:Uma2 family endonuclease